MTFEEVEVNENLDLRRFVSLPTGRWEAGILKMLFDKCRVRLTPADNQGFVPIDYWGGDHNTGQFMLGFMIGVCHALPEEITVQELLKFFPEQNDKELGADFWNRLFKGGDAARALYGR